jgi:hypothetical protein
MIALDEFFEGQDGPRQLSETLRAVVNAIGSVQLRVTRSQLAFRRRKAFAWVWMPGKYLGGTPAPLVLTLSLHSRDASPRRKEIVEPSPRRFTHHLEFSSAKDIDDEVRDWLRDAWMTAA